MHNLNIAELNVLEEARQRYGYKNQIAVATEELNELAAILSKYHRFSVEEHQEALEALREKVLEEVADVEIVLNHVKSVFEISQKEVLGTKKVKVRRIKRWLESSDSLKHTMKDRELDS